MKSEVRQGRLHGWCILKAKLGALMEIGTSADSDGWYRLPSCTPDRGILINGNIG